MLQKELVRYFKSKFNIFIAVVITIPVVLSYYMTFVEKKQWAEQIQSPQEDMNLATTIEIYNSYTSMAFFDKFLSSTDYYIIFVILLLIGFGIHLGFQTHSVLLSGYGNLIMARVVYKKYLQTVLKAQFLYIFSFIVCYFSVLAFFTYITGAVYSTQRATLWINMNPWQMIGHILLLITFIYLLVGITTLLSFLLKNKYFIQAFPIIVYTLTMFIDAFIEMNLNNIMSGLGIVGAVLRSDFYLLILYMPIQEGTIKYFLSFALSLPIFLIALCTILYLLNIKVHSKEYIV
ncbi:hypothetical protein [Bacillus sp. CHD6a]|uniref:hypothetical protein n=1 Tax=Bacillus sp. CHD6a TaxID=1643452 RepID=UPI0006CDEE39|nr:hypothetical protein [Bacillus sp. CHD6a]KPB05181.1 hypothetical protein AAV98_07455 [Bacillus sp. CHD6a]